MGVSPPRFEDGDVARGSRDESSLPQRADCEPDSVFASSRFCSLSALYGRLAGGGSAALAVRAAGPADWWDARRLIDWFCEIASRQIQERPRSGASWIRGGLIVSAFVPAVP